MESGSSQSIVRQHDLYTESSRYGFAIGLLIFQVLSCLQKTSTSRGSLWLLLSAASRLLGMEEAERPQKCRRSPQNSARICSYARPR